MATIKIQNERNEDSEVETAMLIVAELIHDGKNPVHIASNEDGYVIKTGMDVPGKDDSIIGDHGEPLNLVNNLKEAQALVSDQFINRLTKDILGPKTLKYEKLFDYLKKELVTYIIKDPQQEKYHKDVTEEKIEAIAKHLSNECMQNGIRINEIVKVLKNELNIVLNPLVVEDNILSELKIKELAEHITYASIDWKTPKADNIKNARTVRINFISEVIRNRVIISNDIKDGS